MTGDAQRHRPILNHARDASLEILGDGSGDHTIWSIIRKRLASLISADALLSVEQSVVWVSRKRSTSLG